VLGERRAKQHLLEDRPTAVEWEAHAARAAWGVWHRRKWRWQAIAVDEIGVGLVNRDLAGNVARSEAEWVSG